MFLLQRASNAGAVMTIVDGQSRPIFNMDYSTRTRASNPPSWASTVRFAATTCPAVGSQRGLAALVYGDFLKSAYQIVDRAGIRVLRDPFTNTPFVKLLHHQAASAGRS